jgi:hypothetical protein
MHNLNGGKFIVIKNTIMKKERINHQMTTSNYLKYNDLHDLIF